MFRNTLFHITMLVAATLSIGSVPVPTTVKQIVPAVHTYKKGS